MPLLKTTPDEYFTYADYLSWSDEERWELIDGVPYNMSPAPRVNHQRISRKLAFKIEEHLRGKKCEMFVAPFDVRLSESKNTSDNYIDTVVQPDILVICDKMKLDERGCNGAPDLIVEITSPTTGSKDLIIKYELYERHGVKEYWIVHPDEQTVMVFKLASDGMYAKPERYSSSDTVHVPLLGDLTIVLAEIFVE